MQWTWVCSQLQWYGENGCTFLLFPLKWQLGTLFEKTHLWQHMTPDNCDIADRTEHNKLNIYTACIPQISLICKGMVFGWFLIGDLHCIRLYACFSAHKNNMYVYLCSTAGVQSLKEEAMPTAPTTSRPALENCTTVGAACQQWQPKSSLIILHCVTFTWGWMHRKCKPRMDTPFTAVVATLENLLWHQLSVCWLTFCDSDKLWTVDVVLRTRFDVVYWRHICLLQLSVYFIHSLIQYA